MTRELTLSQAQSDRLANAIHEAAGARHVAALAAKAAEEVQQAANAILATILSGHDITADGVRLLALKGTALTVDVPEDQ